MTTKNRQICIEKICNLPVNFKLENKSAWTIAKESNFSEEYSTISAQNIKEFLLRHSHLIEKWIIWSEDKRTVGNYLLISENKFIIGALDENIKKIFEKEYETAIDACSEFVLLEIAAILNIKL
jgi:hypothetical protein